MRSAVVSQWVALNTPLEGFLPYMYTDSEGYVTTGMGNLIDPLSTALSLPWKNSDGSLASTADVTAAWEAVKNAYPGVQSVNCAGLTTLRITQADVQTLVSHQLAANETILRGYFPDWDNFSADAQCGIMFMAWAMGAGFPAKFPQFTQAANTGDWTSIVNLGLYEFKGQGVLQRIADCKQLFQNAAVVEAKGLDPDVLYFPAAAGGIAWASFLKWAAVVGITAVAAYAYKPSLLLGSFARAKGWLSS